MISFEAFDNLPDMYFLLSDRGIILNVNNTALSKLDFNKTDILEKPLSQFCHPASILKLENALILSAANSDVIEIELLFRDSSSKEFDTKATLKSFPFSIDSKSINIFVILRDITADKKKEIDLLRFFFVAENTVNPLQITDLSGKMIYVNRAFMKASGYSEKELIGENPRIFGSGKHSHALWDNMWETISAGKPWVGEVENKRKDGKLYYTQLLISPIINETNTVIGYFGIHRDLTEQRNLEKQLIHTQKMESIGTLAAGVAHEVGNPLASISALAQIIQRSTKETFIIEKLELIKNQINRISKIIRDLVDFSRPSNYELKLTNINENLSEAIEIVKVGKKAKDIKFQFLPDNHLLPVHLVSDQIQQVFVNILINAFDALEEKRSKLNYHFQPEIIVSSKKFDDTIEIIFQDNGPGILPEHTTKIFEPFFTTKVVGKGTGLGLWVSYGIIKSFHGEIKVESTLNRETKFIIELPIDPVY